MKVELHYGKTSKQEKVISIHVFGEKKAICAFIDPHPILNFNKKDRDKFLYELESSINACLNAVGE